MKLFLKLTCGTVICFLAVVSVSAENLNDAGNPYLIIVARNAFGLQPPPTIQKIEAAPPEIALTGISVIFEKKFAFFKTREKNFMLAENQHDDEVELLSVDAQAGAVKIKNHGVLEIITLCKPSAPSFATVATSVSSKNAHTQNVFPVHSHAQAIENENQQPANSGQAVPSAFGATVAGAQRNNQSSGNSLSDNVSVPPENNFSSIGDASDANGTRVYQYWLKGAQEIERARLATAQQVMDGTWQPYPLTPLTPVGTPAQLVGQDSVFMEHGPGVLITSN